MSATVRVLIEATLHDENNRVTTDEEVTICPCGCGCEPDGDWHWSQQPWCPCVANNCPCVTDQQIEEED